MQRNRLWIVGLLVGAVSTALVSVDAAELKLGSQRASLRTASAGTETPADWKGSGPSAETVVQVTPLRPGMPVVTHGPDGGVASVVDETIYSNTKGKSVFSLGSNLAQIRSDDVTFIAKNGCNLRAFKFRVIGQQVLGGTGGPFQIQYGLYPVCPNAASPTPPAIPGTTGTIDLMDVDGMGDVVIHEIEHLIPIGVDVALFPTVHLGIRANRANVGVVGGTPAEVGFSVDRFDTASFPCNSSAGGFPSNPHASYYAQFFGDATCEDTFPGYINTNPAQGGFSNNGGRRCFADDIWLNTTSCNMIGLDVAVRVNAGAQGGTVQVRVHQDAGGLPGAVLAPFKQGSVVGSGPHVLQFNYDPPVALNTNQVWVSFQTTASATGWVMTRQQADLGSVIPGTGVIGTSATFARSIAGKQCAVTDDWEVISGESATPAFPPATHMAFDVIIHCAGDAPVGACCDMFLTDDGICNLNTNECEGGEFDGEFCLADVECEGDPKCLDVPEMNCPFPPRGTAQRPRWQEGLPCNRCSGGPNNNQLCKTDEDCPDGTCVVNQPFGSQTPCGFAACCPPDESGCINTSKKECFRIPPAYRTNDRQWQQGRYCGVDGQRCFRTACLGREGDCLEPKPKFCRGGTMDGAQCNVDSECIIRCGQARCEGGTNSGLFCAAPGDCPGGICVARCTGGDTTRQCTIDAECNDNGVCQTLGEFICIGGQLAGDPCIADAECPGGVCDNKICIGGVFGGQVCDGDRDCREAICEGFPGCSSPLCCEEVCLEEARITGFTFCCDFHWDETCAEIANMLAGAGGACSGSPSNNTCRPSTRESTTEGARVVAIGDTNVAVPMAAATGSDADPGFCCHTGFERTCNAGQFADTVCEEDSDCWDRVCQSICITGPFVGSPCANVRQCKPGGPGEFEPCETDEDCPGNQCVDIQCSTALNVGDCSDQPRCFNPFDGSFSEFSCANDGICNTNRFCREPTPQPGAKAAASLWYRFTPASQGQSVRIDTCLSSNPGADDSMINVFTAFNPNAGSCRNLGQCDGNLEFCDLTAPNCPAGQTCRALSQPLACSISEQDCPLGRPCTADLTTQCGDLVLLGCNDDSSTCARPGNSSLCVPNLNEGQTYFIQVGSKTDQNKGQYRMQVITAASCPNTAANDSCLGAPVVGDGVFAFDLTKASQDCPPPTCGPAGTDDVWFKYVAPATGEATIETCGPNAEMTPDTELAVYFNCDCPRWNESPQLGSDRCSFFCGGDCGEGSCLTLDVEAGQCYLVRVGDRGTGEAGELTITTTAPPCPEGLVTFDPPSGVVDARQTVNPFSGVNMPGISTIHATGPANAPASCWELCETDDGGIPNGLTVTDEGSGMYTLTFDRPITPGACTTIRYLADSGPQTWGTFIAHPGNVNADDQADAQDLNALVNHLNSGGAVPWGLYSSDINDSGMSTAADLMALIDVLNGAGPHLPWLGTGKPSCNACAPLD
jgi:hypothetical protein